MRVLTNGPDMLATANHEVAVMGSSPDEIKWKTVDQLVPGDRLLHVNEPMLSGGTTELPADATTSRSPFSTAKNINFESWEERVGECKHVPVTVLGFGESEVLPTYDITVDEAHCFYADGFLTHNSAGMRQFSETDQEAATAKLGLYSQDEEGNWRVDPKKEALRMANHTRTYHHKPSYQEVEDAVRLQFQSGEGAIQYVPEAVARANADLLNTSERKVTFLKAYADDGGRRSYAENVLRAYAVTDGLELTDKEFSHRMDRYGLNPCGEIISRDFMCNLFSFS